MRSLAEIRFRVRQQAWNTARLAFPPALPDAPLPAAPLAGLPDPAPVADALRGTPWAAEVVRLAEQLLARRFPLLALEIQTGPRIRWRRDYRSGLETGTRFFPRIPYLDARRAGDHKIVWELNRHQHLVALAQAYCFSGRREFLQDLQAQVDTWIEDNPWLRGINWASALEVAFRALSWIWVYHLAANHLPDAFRRRLCQQLYRHACYLERNLSVYFSPNTHLLGEALALHAVGRLFPSFPGARRWEERAASVVRGEIFRQVRDDGAHVEQSTYYHLYALDMFLFHAVLAPVPDAYRERLAAMAGYLDAVAGPCPRLPLIGDDDGGRLFHPYGARDGFARATLAVAGVLLERPEWIDGAAVGEQAAWWLGQKALRLRDASRPSRPPASRLFAAAGTAVLASPDLHVVADAGPFGPWSAGHSHADTLHFVARAGPEELLIDPGTYTYVTGPEQRDWFRGNAAHNTIRLDHVERPAPAGPFAWRGRPEVRLLAWDSGADRDYLDAVCRCDGLTHRRRLLLLRPGLLLVLDDIEGPAGERLVEQFWHFGARAAAISPGVVRVGRRAALALAGAAGELSEGGVHGWRSRGLGHRAPAPVLRVARTVTLPCRLAAALDVSGAAAPRLELAAEGGAARLQYHDGARRLAVVWSSAGPPLVCRPDARETTMDPR